MQVGDENYAIKNCAVVGKGHADESVYEQFIDDNSNLSLPRLKLAMTMINPIIVPISWKIKCECHMNIFLVDTQID